MNVNPQLPKKRRRRSRVLKKTKIYLVNRGFLMLFPLGCALVLGGLFGIKKIITALTPPPTKSRAPVKTTSQTQKLDSFPLPLNRSAEPEELDRHGIAWLMKQGYESQAAQQEEQALWYYHEVWQRDPAAPELPYFLATIALARGDKVLAQQLFDLSLARQEHVELVENILGLQCWKDGLRDQAEEHFRKAIESQKNFPQSYFNLASLLREKKQYTSAVENFRQAIQLNSSKQIYQLKLNLTLIQMGDVEKLMASAPLELGLDPKSEVWLVTSACLQLVQNHPAEAVQFLERARSVLGPQALAELLQDPAFQPYVGLPVLTPYLSPAR